MSNLSRALTAHSTGKLLPTSNSLLDFLRVDSDVRESNFNLCREVCLSATFGQKFLLGPLETSRPDASRQIERRLKRAIIEGVFGEFRANIQKINVALLNHDVRLALEEVANLQDAMFAVDD